MRPMARWFVATNQAGPAYRACGLGDYPTCADVARNLVCGLRAVKLRLEVLYVAIAPPPGFPWPAMAQGRPDVQQAFLLSMRREMEHALGNAGLPDSAVAFDRQWRKPLPGMLISALWNFEIAPQDVIYIGDMETDREAAVAAGVRFVDAAAWRAGEELR